MSTTKGAAGEAVIRIRTVGRDEPMQFEVVVHDRGGETHYQVTMSHTDFERLGGENAPPDECVHAAFLFLLDREPKESILRRFDIAVIERYFPEFPRELPRYRDAAGPISGRRS
jgi:hypothetical protein